VLTIGNNKIDLITASNVFAHADNLKDITKNVFKLLKNGGTFIVEVQYLLNTIKDLTFDNIYHEHVNYWSVLSINKFFNDLGFKVVDVEHIDTHGGSIRVYVKNDGAINENVNRFIAEEIEFGLSNYETYKLFAKKISDTKVNIINNLKYLKSKNYKIAGYGSPAKATTSLNYYGIDNTYLEYTIEDNELKNNKIIPGVSIPIKNKKYCLENLPDIIVVLAWNFFEEIKNNNKELIEKGVKFINIKDLQKENFTFNYLNDNN
jgi:hypothetical protein